MRRKHIDSNGHDASKYFAEGFPNDDANTTGNAYYFFSCGFIDGINAPTNDKDRIHSLESAVQEFRDIRKELYPIESLSDVYDWICETDEKFKQLLTPKQLEG